MDGDASFEDLHLLSFLSVDFDEVELAEEVHAGVLEHLVVILSFFLSLDRVPKHFVNLLAVFGQLSPIHRSLSLLEAQQPSEELILLDESRELPRFQLFKEVNIRVLCLAKFDVHGLPDRVYVIDSGADRLDKIDQNLHRLRIVQVDCARLRSISRVRA